MTLTATETEDLYKIINALDAYFCKRLNKKAVSPQEVFTLRKEAFPRTEIMEAFVTENPAGLDEEALSTVRTWQHAVSGSFLFLKELKTGCWFLNSTSKRVYLVLGLMQPIREIVPFLPVSIEARILPFRGKIVFDGLLISHRVVFSGSMAKGFLEEAKELIANHGLVTSLPAGEPAAVSDSDRLKYLLSTSALREANGVEIYDLCKKAPELECQFVQAYGKLNLRSIKSDLKASKITAGHFAILERTVVAGHLDKAKALAAAKTVVPPHLMSGIVWVDLSK